MAGRDASRGFVRIGLRVRRDVVVENVVRCLRMAWHARGTVIVVHIVTGTRYGIFVLRANPTKKGAILVQGSEVGSD